MEDRVSRCYSALTLGLLALCAASLAAQGPTPAGGEFQVNTYTSDNQWRAAVATSASGDFVVTWSSSGQDGSSDGVFAQRYDSVGAPIGGEFQVNTTTAGSQSYPDVAMDADGAFLVVWSTGDVIGQRFSSNGVKVGAEFTINSYITSSQIQPRVAMTHGGEFVVAWNSNGQDGSSWGIFGQRFDSAATPVGGEFQANTGTTGNQLYPGVGIAESGAFVVTWTSGLTEIYGQRFDSSAAASGGEFHANTTTSGTQRNSDADYDLAGNFVVAWRSNPQDGDGDAVIAQRFAADGSTVGGEFQVNTYTTGNQSSPSVGRAGDGDMVMIWADSNGFDPGQDGDGIGTFGQLVDGSGTLIGSEFQVNTYTTGRQGFSAVAMDDAGNFIATWVSDDPGGVSQDGDFSGVFAQRYRSPCSVAVGLTAGQWKMVSLPCDPGAADTVADVFGDDMTGTYGVDWIVFERNEALERYDALTLGSTLEPRTGYWIKTLDAGETITVGPRSSPVAEVDLVADSDGVQNLVGHPFAFDVCWADVRVIDGPSVLTLDQADPVVGAMRACDMVPADPSCVMSRIMYTWSGSSYSPFDGGTPGAEGTLSEFDALWVKAFKTGTKLRIPARGSAACGGSGSAPASGLRQSENHQGRGGPARLATEPWYVRLIAESEGLRDEGNLLGQLADSVRGPDSHDLKELPPFDSPYLTVVFPHPEWGDQADDYATDFHSLDRSERDEWTFEVRSSADVEQVTLSWEGPVSVLGRLRLFDRTAGRRVPMRPGGSYTFTTDGSSRIFTCRLPGGR